MVDLEALARRAERTATLARARMACRVLVPVALLAALPVASGARIATCACMALVLFAIAALLRWRDRVGVESVTTGLALGALPALAAFALQCNGPSCCGFQLMSTGAALYLVAGVIAGIGVTWRAVRAQTARRQRWVTAMLVASGTAALGCASMGVAALATTLLAVVAGGSLALIPAALRPA